MITESNLYWMTRLDEIKQFLAILGILISILSGAGTIVLIGIFFTNSIEKPPEDKEVTKIIIKTTYCTAFGFFLGMIFVISNIFIPTTKQYAMIKVIPAIANDQRIQQEASELYDMAKQALKQTLQIPNKEPAEKSDTSDTKGGK